MVEMNSSLLEVGIGTKEAQALEPMPVKCIEVKIEPVTTKQGKAVGDKIVFTCQHPKRKDPIDISSIKYEKQGALKVVGSWWQLDEDGKIPKNSGLAVVLAYYKCNNLKEAVGKEFQTVMGENEFLAIKAY